jgi:hypothetical protein
MTLTFDLLLHALYFDNVRTCFAIYEQVSTKFSDLFAFGGRWAHTGEDQRQASHGRLRCRDGGRAIQGTGFVCPEIQKLWPKPSSAEWSFG